MMNHPLPDFNARKQALDISQSFIVQAPAGSGKTEMLTQRFLKLLANTESPESIIALTFTKKAALEMKARIVNALLDAYHETPTNSEHQIQTRHIAKQALQRNHDYQWQLIENPERLKIMTIDALCQKLNQSVWDKENTLVYANIADNPKDLYELAVKNTLSYLKSSPTHAPLLKILLKHLDGREDTLNSLLQDLLAKREQWLKPLFQSKSQQKENLEQALVHIEQHEISHFYSCCPTHIWDEILQLINIFSQRSPENAWLSGLNALSPPLSTQELQRCAKLLLTQGDELRKSFDHHVGLKKGDIDEVSYQEIKSKSKKLLEEFAHYPDAITALCNIKYLPSQQYSDEQWQMLQILFEILPLLMGHLLLVFQQYELVDFSFVAENAIHALGESDNPTDLLLYWDHRIQHLLIDEFQDTSLTQYALLQRLIAGFEEQSGQTLFLVGDPMQSIYRFRQGEVGLFLKAIQDGIGHVKLTPLYLTANFRSNAAIVEWNNLQFKTIFPKQNDIEKGAIHYHPSEIIKQNTDSEIHAYSFDNKQHEANKIIDIIKTQQTLNPNGSIAILVRSRTHLEPILLALESDHINYTGVDIQSLSNQSTIQAVWALTKSLYQPKDRLIWLTFLRSTLAGLSIQSIYTIANLKPSADIIIALNEACNVPQLFEIDEHTRIKFITNTLNQALAMLHQKPFLLVLQTALNTLNREYIFNESDELSLLKLYSVIRQYEDKGFIDINKIENALETLFASKESHSNVQIMTMHKSKGLEFDTVILPGLSAKKSRDNPSLIKFMTLPSTTESLCLISPLKAATEDNCHLYDYLSRIDQEKSQLEDARLLYVATTRAKKNLFLLDYQEKATPNSFRDLLSNIEFIHQSTTDKEESPLNFSRMTRLSSSYYSLDSNPSVEITNPIQKLDITSNRAKHLGILMHFFLDTITRFPSLLGKNPCDIITQFERVLSNKAIHLGVEDFKNELENWLTQILNSNIGRWILEPHQDAQNEFELLISAQGRTATRIIDRTFMENGIRWIIDYKTGVKSKETHSKYMNQLNDYATHWQQFDETSVHCGIFYLETGDWDSWESQTSLGSSD